MDGQTNVCQASNRPMHGPQLMSGKDACPVTQSCLTLWTPGASVHGILQARIIGLPFPTPGDLPHPRIKCTSPSLAGRFFNHWREPKCPSYLWSQVGTAAGQGRSCLALSTYPVCTEPVLEQAKKTSDRSCQCSKWGQGPYTAKGSLTCNHTKTT